jgi:hypothetical protein
MRFTSMIPVTFYLYPKRRIWSTTFSDFVWEMLKQPWVFRIFPKSITRRITGKEPLRSVLAGEGRSLLSRFSGFEEEFSGNIGAVNRPL